MNKVKFNLINKAVERLSISPKTDNERRALYEIDLLSIEASKTANECSDGLLTLAKQDLQRAIDEDELSIGFFDEYISSCIQNKTLLKFELKNVTGLVISDKQYKLYLSLMDSDWREVWLCAYFLWFRDLSMTDGRSYVDEVQRLTRIVDAIKLARKLHHDNLTKREKWSEMGKLSGKARQTDTRPEVLRIWYELEAEGKSECQRAEIIRKRVGKSVQHVRKIIREEIKRI